ncbi:MAG: hypothetical protein M1819_006042 [Sarea resinae]|nr:MAG: hypothetical protein M1819_006042 [Sarea resinae]
MAVVVDDDGLPPEVIRPYKIHVSMKYLELTRKKLELTRLPHETPLPNYQQREYGVPKSVLEPLIDFWQDDFDWRAQESVINSALPQYRSVFTIPHYFASSSDDNDDPCSFPPSSAGTSSSPSTSLRLHFVHMPSTHSEAVPLLFCHGWPGSILDVLPLANELVDPPFLEGREEEDDAHTASAHRQSREEEGGRIPAGAARTTPQAFHVVVPSPPGTAFSDPLDLTTTDEPFRAIAYMYDNLMRRLGYERYLVHGDGGGVWGPYLTLALRKYHSDAILGVHLTSLTPFSLSTLSSRRPSLSRSLQPASLTSHPILWLKRFVARATGSRIPGLRFRIPPAAPDGGQITRRGEEDEEEEGVGGGEGHRHQQLTRDNTKRGRKTPQYPGIRHRALDPDMIRSSPGTLAYGLCDSPAALLAFILQSLYPSFTFSQDLASDSAPEDGEEGSGSGSGSADSGRTTMPVRIDTTSRRDNVNPLTTIQVSDAIPSTTTPAASSSTAASVRATPPAATTRHAPTHPQSHPRKSNPITIDESAQHPAGPLPALTRTSTMTTILNQTMLHYLAGPEAALALLHSSRARGGADDVMAPEILMRCSLEQDSRVPLGVFVADGAGGERGNPGREGEGEGEGGKRRGAARTKTQSTSPPAQTQPFLSVGNTRNIYIHHQQQRPQTSDSPPHPPHQDQDQVQALEIIHSLRDFTSLVLRGRSPE